MTAGAVVVTASGFPLVSMEGNGGADTATLNGTSGDETFIGSPTSNSMTAGAVVVTANGIRRSIWRATAGATQ